MSGGRFYVVTLRGYASAGQGGGGSRVSATSSVLDRFYCHREVARFADDAQAAHELVARLSAEHEAA